MRKLTFVLVLSLFLFGLAGCDLLGDIDQEEVIDTLCEDNPDAEGCQDTIQDTIELASVESLFNTIMAEADNTSVADICELHFSESSQTECTESASLMPTTLGEYRILSVVENVSPMTYDITVESLDGLTEVIFTVTFSQVDTNYVVDAWSYVITQEDPNDDDNNNGGDNEQLTDLDYVASLFTAFIEDYLDLTITNQTVCETYFNGIDTEDCIDNRDIDLSNNFSAELIDIEIIVPGDYIITFTVQNDTMESPQTVELPATYVAEPTPHIEFLIEEEYTEPSSIDETIVLSLFESFIDDYQNSTVSNNTICTLYFNMDDDIICDEILERDPNNLTMSNLTVIEALHVGGDVYDITITYAEEGIEQTESLSVFFYFIEDNLYFTPIDDSPNPNDIEEELVVFETFIGDYQSPSLTNEDLYSMYFNGMAQVDPFMDFRSTLLDNGYMLMIDMVEFMGGNEFYTTLLINDQDYNVILEFDMIVTVDINNEDVYINYMIKEYYDDSNYALYETLLFDMQEAFNDPTIISDAFCTTYFTDQSYIDCYNLREHMMTEGYMLDALEFFYEDIMAYRVQMFFFNSDLDKHLNVYYRTYFEHEDFQIRMTFEEAEPVSFWIDYDMATMYIETMIDSLNSNLPNVDICFDYGHILPECQTFMQSLRDMDANVNLQSITYMYGEVFEVELIVTPLNDAPYYFDMLIEFYLDTEDLLMMRALNVNSFYTYMPHTDASPIVLTFIEDYFNPTISFETMTDTYYNGELLPYYQDERAEFLSLGWTISTIEISQLNVDTIYAAIEVTDSNAQSFILDMYFNVKDYLLGGYSVEYYIEVYPNDIIQPIDLDLHVSHMAEDFINTSIDSGVYCDTYMAYDESCEFVRNRILNNTITSIEYTTDGYFVDVTITYDDGSYEILLLNAFIEPSSPTDTHIYLTMYNISLSLPNQATEITDYTIIENTMSTFITMVFDSSVDAQTLCDMWFGGVLLFSDCIDGRDMIITEGIVMNVIQDTVVQTDDGFYQIDLEMYNPNDQLDSISQITFILYDLGNNTYYINIDYR